VQRSSQGLKKKYTKKPQNQETTTTKTKQKPVVEKRTLTAESCYKIE